MKTTAHTDAPHTSNLEPRTLNLDTGFTLIELLIVMSIMLILMALVTLISSNATLTGVGTVLGATTVNPGGTLAPGNGVGNLAVMRGEVMIGYLDLRYGEVCWIEDEP